jgi:phage-related protein
LNEELKIIISAEISKLKQGIENAKQSVKSFSDKVAEAKKNVDDKFKTMGSSIATGAKAMVTGLAAGTTALLALGASTAEYRTEQAKLVTAFESAGSSAEQAKTTYNELQRVLGDSGVATEAAGHLAKLTTNEKALSEWTNICQGVYATFGDSLQIEGLTEAANETAKVGTVTGTLADALNWAGVNEDAFNESLAACNTEAEREALIRSTLTGLYDEAAKGYEKNSAEVIKQNEAQAKLQETTAKLGEAVAPVVTAFTEFANNALAAVTPYVQSLAENYLPLLKTALEGITEGLASAFEWIQQHQTLLAVIAGVITGLVASIGLYNAVAAVKAAMDAAQVTTLAGLAAAYLAQAAAMVVAIAPYALIVAAIAAVIAIIVVCVKHWDKISATVKKVAADIAKWVSDMASKAVAKFNELKDKATQKIESLKQSATEKFNALKQSATEKIQSAKTAVTEAFSNMVSSGKEKLSNMVSAVKEKFDSIKSSIKEKIDGAKNLVKSGLDAIKNFFSSAKWELPKIKLPHFSISGKFSINPPSMPKVSVSWYKLGGVFDSPTLFPYGNGSIGGLGEAGAEAIVPLEETKWIDVLADRMKERLGVNTPIVLNVDGKVFAQTAINTINQQTRQTGKLALNLV